MARKAPVRRYVGTAGGNVFSTTGKGARADLVGVDDLEAALLNLSEDMQGEALRKAVTAGAEITRDVASQLAPMSADGSHGRPRGFLSRSIHAVLQWTRSQDTADVHVGASKEAFYGPKYQERGTIHQPAQPFLRPALDQTKDDVLDEIAEQLRNRILQG